MTTYVFEIEIEADSLEHAQQVLCERCDYSEQYEDTKGEKFAYTIEYHVTPVRP